MTPKKYESFEEIDIHLKILKLQRNVEKEQLVFNCKTAIYLLYPKNIAFEISNIIKQKLIAILLNRFSWVF